MLSNAETRFIVEQLRHYHCTEREATIYLAALRMGPSSVQDLSVAVAENRITVHSAVATLLKKGLLHETRRGKRRLLCAEDPESLFRLLQIKERELQDARANLGYMVGLLRKEYSPSTRRPTVRFHEGPEGFKRMLEMSLSAENEFLAIINVELFSQQLQREYLQEFFERRASLGINSRLIWSNIDRFAEGIIPHASRYRVAVRILHQQQEWRSGFISWNNCVSLKSFSAGRITCTIVENDDIADFYRHVLFEHLWSAARPATH